VETGSLGKNMRNFMRMDAFSVSDRKRKKL